MTRSVRRWVLFFLAGALAGMPVRGDEAAGPGVPRIFSEEPVFDFGSADNSETIEHTFVVRNTGDAPLKIERTRTSCGCTVASITARHLEPGETAELKARLNLRGRRGMQSKAITIVSNDPEQPNFELRMKGTAVESLQVTPRQVFFGQLNPSSEVEKRVTLLSRDDVIGIESAETTIDGVEVDILPSQDGKTHSLLLRTRPPLVSGSLRGDLMVRTTSGKKPLVRIPLRGEVVGALAYAPKSLVLPAGSSPVTRYVMIKPGSVREFNITGMDVPDPAIQVNVYRMQQNAFRIQLGNILPRPELDGKAFVIRTDAPDMPEVSIPFSVTP